MSWNSEPAKAIKCLHSYEILLLKPKLLVFANFNEDYAVINRFILGDFPANENQID